MGPVTGEPWGPLGLALRDYFNGDLSASVTLVVDEGEREALPAAHFFRGEDELPEAELVALGLCRGRVLDAGAGVGSHALVLQRRGLEVCALDIAPLAVEIMKKRGVRDARRGDVFTFAGSGFDTLLMLMNGVGVVGDLGGFERFLGRADELLAPGGQVLFDSTDVGRITKPGEQAALRRRRRAGRYGGEVRFRIAYKETIGPPLSWLFLDPDRLRTLARRGGWAAQILFEDAATGEFTARLVRRAGP
jgi:SAM-dependent methyltransferase